MKQLRQTRAMTRRALFITAFCTHLLIASLSVCGAQGHEIDSPPTDRSVRFTASQPRDYLVARTSSTTLSLHQSQRRSDPLAAAIISRLASLTFTEKPAHITELPTARAHASLLPAASRAPPSLVA
jgi:hypothetical protein